MNNKSYEHIIKLLLEKYGWVRVPLFIGGQYENRKNWLLAISITKGKTRI